MANLHRPPRRRLLAPSGSGTGYTASGLTGGTPAVGVGRTSSTGCADVVEARRRLDVERSSRDRRFRRATRDGSATCAAVRDGLPSGGRRSVAEFHTGWAQGGRVERGVPDLSGDHADPAAARGRSAGVRPGLTAGHRERATAAARGARRDRLTEGDGGVLCRVR
ncbi:hypothetical protein [Saccharothrix luteola]|uniref:hypothetical protein n=1 Tax=Saccharothrix luteola TaxID=2893018 RepID=UPI001E652F33|nr:hypothetical protein [Saccharothrix luteola]MCC8247006.1 hypothetical protein [Saccharothrix luteola]